MTMSMFTEHNGSFSWRKAITAAVTITFVIVVLGYVFIGAREMPAAYEAIMALVIGAYFAKNRIRNTTKSDGTT